MEKVVKDRIRRQDQNGAEKRNLTLILQLCRYCVTKSCVTNISELTKSIKDSRLAFINRIEALVKQEKHKSIVGNNKREAQASCSFAQFSEEVQEPLRDDDMIDPPAKKRKFNLDFEEDLVAFFLPKKTRSLMTSMNSFYHKIKLGLA